MPKFLLRIQFDGRNFCGSQMQKNGRTVQGELRRTLGRIFGTFSDLAGCSRTDSGVHALDYCVSFAAETRMDCSMIQKALNANLSADLAVVQVLLVPENFHARYDVVSKEYVYRIRISPVRSPFWEGLALQDVYSADLGQLNRGASLLVGTHDFSSFMAAGSKITDPVRTVVSAGFERNGDLLLFRVRADGFLYHMVRIMVGTLLAVPRKYPAEQIRLILQGKNRKLAGPTAPACGLYLEHVFYDRI